jgi:GT2 family glycosyltransferase
MTLVRPVVSVIIPTHDRRAALERLLGALGAQTYPSAFLEVIVVADGCRDGTADMLRQYPPPPFRLKLVELPGSGAAAARNRGSAEATGALLVFLDDDIEPGPGLIDAHVRAHGDGADALAIGRLIFPEEQERSLFRIGLRAWWEEQFLIMRQPGHRFSYRDIFAGNCSVSAGLFARLGGFDAALPRRQDGEFGFRVMQAGGAVTFAEDAIGYHHDESDVVGSWRRAHDEGRGDILMGRRHPEVRADLLLARFDGPLRVRDRLVRALAFGQPSVGDAAASLLGRRLLPLAERLRWRRLWGRLFFGLRTHWYLRGAARELGSRAALSQFLHGGSARGDQDGCETEVDLDEGLVAAERRLDRDRPAAVRLCCRGRVVGRIPARVGAERLRGAHLRPMLATQLASAQVAPPVMAATWTTGGDMAIRVLDREVTEGAAPIRGAEHCDCLYTLVRYRGEPIGWLLVRNPGRQPTISPDREAEAMEEQLGEALAVAVLKEQVSERPALDAALPPISVVVCTRDRADLLAGCLEAIRALDYPHYEVIVVDNAPADARTANLTAGLAVRYVCERRPGLD